MTPVPVAGPWVLIALWLTLVTAGVWLLRRDGNRQPFGPALLLASLAAAGLWNSASLRAQLSVQFTDPAGETLAIPVNQIIVGGVLQGFQRVDYLNASGASQQIATIDPPDFDDCFPEGLDTALPPPDASSGSACEVGTVLEDGDSCRVDVDAICRELEADATALIDVAPPALTFSVGDTGSVTITADASSPVPAKNVAATIPGGSSITVSSSSCAASLAPGLSCQIDFTSSTPASASVSISGDNTAAGTVAISVTTAIALIDVSPTSVTFAENSTVVVTVSTEASSPVPATNVAATIPAGSNVSVVSSTCGASLAQGASCQIAFTSPTQENSDILIAGDNTATETVAVSVVAQPVIFIAGPVQSSRVVAVGGMALDLEITNDAGGAVNAQAITVTNKTAVPNVVVDDSNCTSVAPGASCTLSLTSATPYAPGTITIGGSNTANSPSTLVVFSHLGGLVFEESGGSGKIVIDVAQAFTSAWTGLISAIAGAGSLDNGVANSDSIVANAACSGDPADCAAQQCRNIGADWYLPARNELSTIASALCSNAAIPCNAGGFSSTSYWSSSQLDVLSAWLAVFPDGLTVTLDKSAELEVRCVRTF